MASFSTPSWRSLAVSSSKVSSFSIPSWRSLAVSSSSVSCETGLAEGSSARSPAPAAGPGAPVPSVAAAAAVAASVATAARSGSSISEQHSCGEGAGAGGASRAEIQVFEPTDPTACGEGAGPGGVSRAEIQAAEPADATPCGEGEGDGPGGVSRAEIQTAEPTDATASEARSTSVSPSNEPASPAGLMHRDREPLACCSLYPEATTTVRVGDAAGASKRPAVQMLPKIRGRAVGGGVRIGTVTVTTPLTCWKGSDAREPFIQVTAGRRTDKLPTGDVERASRAINTVGRVETSGSAPPVNHRGGKDRCL